VIVCHCRSVNHTTVLDAIDRGARCPDEVAAHCGAGSVCGGCRPTVQSLCASSAELFAVAH
jgi:bacterioferritin-associated ferredoxin